MDVETRLGVKAVRPWSRPGEQYAGYQWPQDGGAGRGRGASYRAENRGATGGDAAGPAWDEVTLAGVERVVTDPGFAERELNPLLALGEQLRRARGAVLSRVKRHTWRGPLERALGGAAERGLVAAETPARAAAWCAETPEDAREALRALWSDLGLSPADHLGLFLHALPPRVARDPRERLTLATVLLGAIDPLRFPPLVGDAQETDAQGSDESDPGLAYRSWLGALDELMGEAERRGVSVASRLHAVGVLHALRRGERALDEGRLARAVGETRLRALEAPADAEVPRSKDRSLGVLARRLLIAESELAKIVRLLDDRGQCVFYGPPGTGKTHVARALAEHLASGEECVRLVQFHPSYAYEDFVEGYRPVAPEEGGTAAGFALHDGPLKEMARAARERPAERFVLVIDELNRANVSKVFGELYYLLEYRGESIGLQYSRAPFALPANLTIIATMNAADRSIALVDLALRRRFYFVPFYPDAPPVEGLLRRWLESHRPGLAWVAEVVDRANERLVARHDRHAAIGPSHFMRDDLSEEWVELIWEHAVLPTIAELFFGDEGAVEEFRLERLRPPARGKGGARGGSGGTPATRGKRRAPARAR